MPAGGKHSTAGRIADGHAASLQVGGQLGQVVAMGTFQAVGFQAIVKPKLSLMITVMRGVVLNSILVFVLPAMFGVSGIWAVVTVSEVMTAIAVLYFMRKERR